MRWSQLESGISIPFYKYNYELLVFLLTPTWFTHIREYLYSCNVTINEKDPWLYIPPRENDFFLMDLIIEAAIPDEHKIIFNEIRMHQSIQIPRSSLISYKERTVEAAHTNGQTPNHSQKNGSRFGMLQLIHTSCHDFKILLSVHGNLQHIKNGTPGALLMANMFVITIVGIRSLQHDEQQHFYPVQK